MYIGNDDVATYTGAVNRLYYEFIKDAYEIQELRGFLWERHDNKPKALKDASDFHYHGFNHEIESIFEVFVRKYDGMNLNVD